MHPRAYSTSDMYHRGDHTNWRHPVGAQVLCISCGFRSVAQLPLHNHHGGEESTQFVKVLGQYRLNYPSLHIACVLLRNSQELGHVFPTSDKFLRGGSTNGRQKEDDLAW